MDNYFINECNKGECPDPVEIAEKVQMCVNPNGNMMPDIFDATIFEMWFRARIDDAMYVTYMNDFASTGGHVALKCIYDLITATPL